MSEYMGSKERNTEDREGHNSSLSVGNRQLCRERPRGEVEVMITHLGRQAGDG